MVYAGQACPADSILLSVAASRELAATNRWVFDFAWSCNVSPPPVSTPIAASVRVAIVDMATRPIDGANRTIGYPLDPASPPTEYRAAGIVTSGGIMGDSALPFEPSAGTYLSIRREGDRFAGGLFLTGLAKISTGEFPGQFSGAFDVPVP